MKKIIINIVLIFSLCSCAIKAYSQSPEDVIKNKLIGTWVLNDEPTTKVVYDTNNNSKLYQNNVLKDSDEYLITKTCDSETLTNGKYFIKTTDADGYSTCEIIEGISEENGVITLSLTSDRGQHQLLTKQP